MDEIKIQIDETNSPDTFDWENFIIGETWYRFKWKNNPKRAALYDRRCRVLRRLKKNSAIVEFENGQQECVSRSALEKIYKEGAVKPIIIYDTK